MTVSVSRAELRHITIALDPAVTSGESSDDSGIVVVARGPCQPSTCKLDRSICTGHGYVLEDLTCHVAPREWARITVDAYHRWEANRVVGEVNNGGDMISDTLRAIEPGLPFRQVRATRGKQLRAEPASTLHDQGRLHMLGIFRELEDQMVTWTLDASWSPDRLDALVYGLMDCGLIGAVGAAFMGVWKEEVRSMPQGPRIPRSVHLEGYSPRVLDARCKHRFFDDGLCVHCGGPDPKGA